MCGIFTADDRHSGWLKLVDHKGHRSDDCIRELYRSGICSRMGTRKSRGWEEYWQVAVRSSVREDLAMSGQVKLITMEDRLQSFTIATPSI
jgi:hypothetical protein